MYTLIALPNIDLFNKSSWIAFGRNRYAASRFRIVMFEEHEETSRYGPPLEAYSIVKGAKHTIKFKYKAKTLKTESIRNLVRDELDNGFRGSIVNILSGEVEAKKFGCSASLKANLTGELECISKAISEKISEKSESFYWETCEEREMSIELDDRFVGDVTFRHRYWPVHFYYYLYSVEYIELSYNRRFILWKNVRDTIREIKYSVVKSPLFCLTYYKQQPVPDISPNHISNTLTNPNIPEISNFFHACPDIKPRKDPSLEEFAQMAFPVSKEDKQKARHYSETYRIPHDLLVSIAKESNLSLRESDMAINSILSNVTKTLNKGEKVYLGQFGSFVTAKRSVSKAPQKKIRIPVFIVAKGGGRFGKGFKF